MNGAVIINVNIKGEGRGVLIRTEKSASEKTFSRTLSILLTFSILLSNVVVA